LVKTLQTIWLVLGTFLPYLNKTEQKASMILKIGQEKAFDRMSYKYLFPVFKGFKEVKMEGHRS